MGQVHVKKGLSKVSQEKGTGHLLKEGSSHQINKIPSQSNGTGQINREVSEGSGLQKQACQLEKGIGHKKEGSQSHEGNGHILGKGTSQWCPVNCVCCKYPSPIKIDVLIPLLQDYPDRKSAIILREGFVNGFRLGYLGDRKAREAPNLKSVLKDPVRAVEKLNKEIQKNRIAGPFKECPIKNLMVSPIGLVPKSEPGKFRLIQHLSYPEGDSINDKIDPAICTVKYTSFDEAVRMVVCVGKGALMAKADIESAFRLLPIHPADFQLLGIKVQDDYYVDRALPMGASCSPALFEKFSTFVEWVARREAATDRVIHYADDFLLCGEEFGNFSCARLVSTFENVCKKLGVPLAHEKSVGPTTKLTYLGLEIDSVRQVVAIPENKLITIKKKVEDALNSTRISVKSLQSVIGSLSFVCKAISPGRAFLRRLIDLTCGNKKANVMIRLSEGAKTDLEMWHIFLQRFNGTTMIPDQAWVDGQDLELYTDASGEIGFGGYFKGKWFQGRWPSEEYSRYSIAWLEFFPIVVAVVIWGEMLKGKRIIIRTDNQAVVSILNRQTSKCPKIMKLLRFFVLQCLKLNVAFCARHIAGKNNNIADALSRFQMERFRGAAPTAEIDSTPVPVFLWKL